MTLTPGLSYLLSNFAETTLEAELSDVAVTCLVASATDFPTIGANQAFRVTLYDGSQSPEIVEVTAVSSETLTITRAQESTTAKTWASGTLVRLAPTAGILSLMTAVPANGVQWFPRAISEILSVPAGYGAMTVAPQFATDVNVAASGVLSAQESLTLATGQILTVATGGVVVIPGNEDNETFADLVVTNSFTSPGIDDNADAIIITIASSGNIGIGNSALESWPGTWTALQIGNGTSLVNTANGGVELLRNAYNDGAWKYQSTDEASNIEMSAGGAIVFNVAPSGTADTAISWTKALTIDNGGHTIFPSVNDAVTPTLAFGDGDTGFYESADDNLRVSIAGSPIVSINVNALWMVQQTNGAYLANEAPSSTNPVLTFLGDTDTGLGRNAADELSLIAGGSEGLRIAATATYVVQPFQILERAAALTSLSNYGQLWVKNTTPCQLWFTDDAGTDTQIV